MNRNKSTKLHCKQAFLMKEDIFKCIYSNIFGKQKEEVNKSVWEIVKNGSEQDLFQYNVGKKDIRLYFCFHFFSILNSKRIFPCC